MTREGTDVVERAAMAHCAMAVDLGLSVTPWDGLRQGDRVVARMCMEAATADMRAELTRLRAENEALKEALRTISLMSKEHEHDLFSATQVARAALKETDKEGQGGGA